MRPAQPSSPTSPARVFAYVAAAAMPRGQASVVSAWDKGMGERPRSHAPNGQDTGPGQTPTVAARDMTWGQALAVSAPGMT